MEKQLAELQTGLSQSQRREAEVEASLHRLCESKLARVVELEREQSSSSGALAQDVAMLADEAASVRADFANQIDVVVKESMGRVEELEMYCQQQLQKSADDVAAKVTHCESKSLERLTKLSEQIESMQSEQSSFKSQVQLVESAAGQHRDEIVKLVMERSGESNRRLEGLSHAVKVFADMAQLPSLAAVT
eukprot:TRINITY_DN61686_c0_g1_i1.p1 TRINITY_DN61686_c0_g1~~TRINITY_DN61686_c0_g1_i1.p1  ORF type:complete len:191 (+),score=58.44 TRINITY_DN61686_c0_g1_i1:90-662(+)